MSPDLRGDVDVLRPCRDWRPVVVPAIADNCRAFAAAVFLNAEFSAPWCVRGEAGMAIYRHRLQPYEHMVFFHYLTEGGCKVRLSGDGSVLEVSEGDIVVFPRDDGHFIGSDLQIAPLGAEDVNSNDAEACTDVVQLRHGGGGATTRFVCGYMLCGSKRQFGMPPAMWRRTAPS